MAVKRKLTLYRTKGMDYRGKKFYNSSKNLQGDIYFFDSYGDLYRFDYDNDGKEKKSLVRMKIFDIVLKEI